MKTNRYKKVKAKIDNLLEQNAKYQAANVCVTNTPEEQKKINEHCNTHFIEPIKKLDSELYDFIKKQSDV
tara:strand:- start:3195 stop:3404 length:210 start_codon:yes stop_codon:yes gene_type:complete